MHIFTYIYIYILYVFSITTVSPFSLFKMYKNDLLNINQISIQFKVCWVHSLLNTSWEKGDCDIGEVWGYKLKNAMGDKHAGTTKSLRESTTTLKAHVVILSYIPINRRFSQCFKVLIRFGKMPARHPQSIPLELLRGIHPKKPPPTRYTMRGG